MAFSVLKRRNSAKRGALRSHFNFDFVSAAGLGSTLSLVSTTSSMYSTPEEKQAHEIRRLRKELEHSNDKVVTLTAQLTTNVSSRARFVFFLFPYFLPYPLQRNSYKKRVQGVTRNANENE